MLEKSRNALPLRDLAQSSDVQEVQIPDSWGREKAGPGDIGGLYGGAAPKLNAAKAPGEWQQFAIEFQAHRYEDAKKVANAVFKKVLLNGQVIHENVATR